MRFKSWAACALILCAVGSPGAALAADQAVLQRYYTSCISCHANGAANAPRTGDAARWQSRLDKGMDALVASVRNGLGAMPPGGMCRDCTDEELAALISFMASGK
jgi:cytochrome c5